MLCSAILRKHPQKVEKMADNGSENGLQRRHPGGEGQRGEEQTGWVGATVAQPIRGLGFLVVGRVGGGGPTLDGRSRSSSRKPVKVGAERKTEGSAEMVGPTGGGVEKRRPATSPKRFGCRQAAHSFVAITWAIHFCP